MMHGFIKGVSMDVSYLKIDDVLAYNLPYMQSNFTCNPGPTVFIDRVATRSRFKARSF